MRYEGNAASDAVLAELSRQAVVGAADRLGVDPLSLARGLTRGRLADLILELKMACNWAYPRDRDRIEVLLEQIDRRFLRPVAPEETGGVLPDLAARAARSNPGYEAEGPGRRQSP